MAPSKKTTTVAVSTSSTQLDSKQVQKASTALVRKIQSDSKSTPTTTKANLLADADSQDATDDVPIWLILTTKKHIIDKKRLKPGKITIPHPYLKPEQENEQPLRICLITADPQRQFKDMITHPNFPLETSKLISRVIGLEKLKSKYNSAESKRQLLSEHDVFLADDRIITYLPKVLGKVFYNTSAKRPIPVSLQGRRQNFDEQGNKRRKLAEGGTKVVKSEAKPSDVAAEIEKTLSCALVHLAPSTTTAVKVGFASMDPAQIQANVEAVVNGLVETYVPKKWQNVRAIHIKGPNTIALPVWLTDELWVDEEDIKDEAPPLSGKSQNKRKRGALTQEEPEAIEVPGPDGKMRRLENPKKQKKESAGDVVDVEKADKAARKDALKKQKAAINGVVAKDVIELKHEKENKPAKKGRMKAADLN